MQNSCSRVSAGTHDGHAADRVMSRHSTISENHSKTSRKVLETGKKRADILCRFLGILYKDRNYPSREELAAAREIGSRIRASNLLQFVSKLNVCNPSYPARCRLRRGVRPPLSMLCSCMRILKLGSGQEKVSTTWARSSGTISRSGTRCGGWTSCRIRNSTPLQLFARRG